MRTIRFMMLGFILVVLLAACANGIGKERGRVHCPACGVELDSLYEKHF